MSQTDSAHVNRSNKIDMKQDMQYKVFSEFVSSFFDQLGHFIYSHKKQSDRLQNQLRICGFGISYWIR